MLTVTCSDLIGDPRHVDPIVVTIASGGRTQQVPLLRKGRGWFVGDIELARGRQMLTVTARSTNGTRLRAVIAIDVSR